MRILETRRGFVPFDTWSCMTLILWKWHDAKGLTAIFRWSIYSHWGCRTRQLSHTNVHTLSLPLSFTLLYPAPFECKCSDTTGYYSAIDTCGESELHTILFSFKNFDWLLLIVDRGAGSVEYKLRNLLFNRLWNPLSISSFIQRPNQFSASFNQIELTVCVR